MAPEQQCSPRLAEGLGVRLLKYFPTLTDRQKEQFAALDALYRDWNSKINVISRKDIDNLYEHHVLHSLAIAELIREVPPRRFHRQEDTRLPRGQQSPRAGERHDPVVPR